MKTEKKRGLACSVNRLFPIDTLEAKERAKGYRFVIPPSSVLGRFEVKAGFEVRSLTEVRDVDGVLKKTLKTEYFDADGAVRKKTALGVNRKGGKSFHGYLSGNWEPEVLSPEQVIAVLGEGYSITPGCFRQEAGLTRRGRASMESVEFILMDADDWDDACPAPLSIGELLERFPSAAADFYWIGESISSRSSLKPEMRFRVMVLLPEPIPVRRDAEGKPVSEGDAVGREAFDIIIEKLLARYPFLALGPSRDAVRLAFGNGRPDRREQVLGGRLSETLVAQCFEEARESLKQKKTAGKKRAQKEVRRKEYAARSGEKTGDDPLDAFKGEGPRSLLEKHGFSYLHSSGNEDIYNFDESGPGRSCAVRGEVLKPFSGSLVAATPAALPEPVNVYRLVLWFRYSIDLEGINASDMDTLKKRLSEDGWGTYKPRRKRRAGATVKRVPEKVGERVWRGPIDLRALDFIKPEECSYQEWLEVGIAIKSAGLAVGVWDTWSRGDRKRYKRGECAAKWKTFSAEGLVSWERVFNLAVKGEYKTLPAGAAMGRRLIDVRAALGDRLSSLVSTPVMPGVKEFHFIPSDTGAGKTRAFLAIPEALLYIGMHGAGVDAAAEEAAGLGRSVLRWRSRWHGFKALYEHFGGDRDAMMAGAFGVFKGVQNMCPSADRAEMLAARGHSVEDNLCRNCSLNKTCGERGYLAQYREAVLAEVVCIALPELQLVLDRAWASMARRLDRRVDDDDDDAIEEGALHVRERVAGIDDATPWSLLVKRFVSLSVLESMIMERDERQVVKRLVVARNAARFSDVLAFQKRAVSVDFLTALRDALRDAEGGDNLAVFRAFEKTVSAFRKEKGLWEQVIKELARIPVYLIPRFSGGSWTVETPDGETSPLVAAPGPGAFGFEVLGVAHRSEIKRDKLYRCFLSLDDLVAAGLAGYDSGAAVAAIPAVSDAKHGWVSSLTDLIGEAGCPENAPVSYDLLEGRFEWAVSPHLNFKRSLYLSATAVEKHVKLAAMGTRARVQFFSYPREPLAWMPGCCVYQLVDGKMTEQSFYIREAGKVIGPAARLEDFVSVVSAQISKGDRVLVVTREAVRSEALKDTMGPLLALEAAGKVSIINFSEMVGRNDFSAKDVVFLILPEPSPVELESVCRSLYRGDTKPLSFEREPGVLESCEVEVKMKLFVDDRVQEVYETLVSHYLYQAAMRLRPALSGDKQIVLLTSFPVPGLSDRGAVLVSWQGLLAAEGGDVRNAIEYRGEVEDVRDAVRAGDTVQEAAAKAGVSTRQGYRDTAEVRREIKETRDAWIRELHAAGMTQREIAETVGCSDRQVRRLLKK